MNFQIIKLDIENAEEQEIKLPTTVGSSKKQGSSRKNIYSALLIMPKPSTGGSQETVENLQDIGIPDHLNCLLRSLYAGQEGTSRTGHGKTNWFKLRKEYVKDAYWHPAYSTFMQSTSCEMPGWMKHKLKSRLLGEMSVTSDMQMTPSLWQKAKRN